MKTIVVLSDTHGNMARLRDIAVVLAECDLIIHLGDTSSDGMKLKKEYGDKVVPINGNCDSVKFGDDERVLEVEGVRFFLTHGHLYSVKSTLSNLSARAAELGCGIALYGHTHAAREEEINGVTAINPGNMSRYSRNSYCYIVVNGGKAVYKTVDLY